MSQRCPQCNLPIDAHAKGCPACGCRLKETHLEAEVQMLRNANQEWQKIAKDYKETTEKLETELAIAHDANIAHQFCAEEWQNQIEHLNKLITQLSSIS